MVVTHRCMTIRLRIGAAALGTAEPDLQLKVRFGLPEMWPRATDPDQSRSLPGFFPGAYCWAAALGKRASRITS